jgi:hypothetical protein
MQDLPPTVALTLPPGLVAEVEVAAAEDHRLPQDILHDAVAAYVRIRRLQKILDEGRRTPAVLLLDDNELGQLIIQSRAEMRQRA